MSPTVAPVSLRRTNTQFSTLPEVVPQEHQDGSAPERVPMEWHHDESHLVIKNSGWDTTDWERSSMSKEDRKVWWNRRSVWLVAALVAITVVGASVGLSVWHLMRKNKVDTPPAPTPSLSLSTPATGPIPSPTVDMAFGQPTSFSADIILQPSVCHGTVCPSMLATAQLAKSDSPSFFVFSRGLNQAIWYRQGDRYAWNADWQTLGGNFKSQPVAIVINDNRVYVFAVWVDGSVAYKSYLDGRWTESWTNLQGNSINTPTVCSSGPNNIELFATDEKGLLTHRRYNGNSWSTYDGQNSGDPWQHFSGFVSAGVAAVCSREGNRVDVVSYGGYANKRHGLGWMHYSEGKWTSDWEHNNLSASSEDFRGDPALVAIDEQTSAALGIGADGQVYNTTWSVGTGFSQMSVLGKQPPGTDGGFESVPHVFTTPGTAGGKSRTNVLVVSKNATLLQQAWEHDGSMSNGWTDLGGFFQSAPVSVRSPDGWVAVFGIGPDGHLIHGNFTMMHDLDWKKGAWYDDGALLAQSWYRAGPAK